MGYGHNFPGGESVRLEASSATASGGIACGLYRPDGTKRSLKPYERLKIRDMVLAQAAAGVSGVAWNSAQTAGLNLMKGTLPIGVIYPNWTDQPPGPDGQVPYMFAPTGQADVVMSGSIVNTGAGDNTPPWMNAYDVLMKQTVNPKDTWFPLNEKSGLWLSDFYNNTIINVNGQPALTNYNKAAVIPKSGSASYNFAASATGLLQITSGQLLTDIITSPVSWGCWFKPAANNANYVLMSGTDNTVNHYGILTRLRANGQIWSGYGDLTTSTSCVQALFAFGSATPLFLVTTWDGATITLYINGQLGGTVAYAGANIGNWSNFVLGDGTIAGVEPANGQMQDAFVTKRVLTSSEVNALYRAGMLGLVG